MKVAARVAVVAAALWVAGIPWPFDVRGGAIAAEERATTTGEASRLLEWRPLPGQHRYRVRVRVHARDILLLGILEVSGKGSVRAIALDNIGGRLFDVVVRPRDLEIVQKARWLPGHVLRHGIVEELRILFLPGTRTAPRGGRRWTCREEGNTLHRVRCEMTVHGRLARVVSLVAARENPVSPRRIEIENRQYGYRVSIRPLAPAPGPRGSAIPPGVPRPLNSRPPGW